MRNVAIILPLVLLLSACESAYYDVLEKVGVHNRKILIDRIEAGQESQDQG